MTPAIQSLREKLQPVFDRINAKHDFDAVAATVVVGGLDPAEWRDQARIDRLSRRAEFGERRGKVRRRVWAAAHLLCWEFEMRADAEAFLAFAVGLELAPTILDGPWPAKATYLAVMAAR